MPNFNQSTQKMLAAMGIGMRVDRQVDGIVTGQNPIFTVHDGPVLVTLFIGVVSTQLQAAALLLHLDFNADAGAGFDFDLSVDSADLTGDDVGTMYIPPATVAGALTTDGGGGLNICPQWILPAGTLDLHASASRTGEIDWSLWYIPLVEGAYVTAHA
jgi:hypothetical protein